VAALLAAGADPKATTKKGKTALALATEYGHDAVVRQLQGEAEV